VAAMVEQERNVELLREALAILDRSELRLERARVLVDLGAALRRRGARSEARDLLSQGMDIAHGCGARGLVDRARTELLAAGARPRRERRTGFEALTPSEQRVVALAAEGRTNRQIAQQLFVSARTVESHLGSAYVKLGVGSRQDLVRLYADWPT
jgi:DNA-binding CsgD family transcriptional regulator